MITLRFSDEEYRRLCAAYAYLQHASETLRAGPLARAFPLGPLSPEAEYFKHVVLLAWRLRDSYGIPGGNMAEMITAEEEFTAVDVEEPVLADFIVMVQLYAEATRRSVGQSEIAADYGEEIFAEAEAAERLMVRLMEAV